MAQTKVKEGLIDAVLGGGLTLISTPKTAGFTAVAGESYLVDTSSSAITVALPGSPSVGDEIGILDYASNAATNNITIDPGTLNFRGATNDFAISANNESIRLIYSGATKGWLLKSGTGAAVVTLTVDYLVVAGGGSGATQHGGGGGAGGLRTSYTNSSSLNGHSETALSLSASTNYTILIGGGAAGVTGAGLNLAGNNGSDSKFGIIGSEIISTGGGGGSAYAGSTVPGSGGSGGGGGNQSSQTQAGGAAVTSPSQGYAGGTGHNNTQNYPSGGGGGAGGVGGNGTATYGGNGGDGLEVNIIGTTGNYYAGGGGSGTYIGGTPGTGGSSIGGAGKNNSSNGNPGVNYTGSGGGGTSGSGYTTGAGGGGVIILRYSDTYTIAETTSSQLTFTTDSTTVANIKITTFTAGTGTIEFTN